MAESNNANADAPRPLVSVVIPAFNAAAHIREALESVDLQRGDFAIEVVVVDDGSRDATCSVVEAFQHVKLVRQNNGGPSAARNRGITESSGEYIAFLDADDLWPEGKLAAQFAVFERYPEVGLVFGDCRIFTEAGEKPSTQFESMSRGPRLHGEFGVLAEPYKDLFEVNYIPTGSVVVRRQCFLKAGMFDENRRLVEDKELWFRLAMHCQFGYTTQLCELKREHEHNVSSDREGMALAHISVLLQQQEVHPEKVKACGVDIPAMVAYEYSILGDRCERRGEQRMARRWYSKAFLTHPSLRPAYYWLRSWL